MLDEILTRPGKVVLVGHRVEQLAGFVSYNSAVIRSTLAILQSA